MSPSVEYLTSRLNYLTDRAAVAVSQAEAYLSSIRLANAPSVDIPGRGEVLSFRRHNGRMRIVVVTQTDVKAWAETDQSTKLDSVGLLPTLLAGVAPFLERRVADAERSVASAEDAVAALINA
jgi:hypothetical protein